MDKINICVLFGGVSPEHEISLRSGASVLRNLDPGRYNIFPVGIKKDGSWVLYGGTGFDELENGSWIHNPRNKAAFISPVRGAGLVTDSERIHLDCVFPVLHGENGEDGSMQGLLKIAGLPFVGSGVFASAAAMDKAFTKIICDYAGICQADFFSIYISDFERTAPKLASKIESRFAYPVFIKPASAGSSVGISKAGNTEELLAGIKAACGVDRKIIVEEFIDGREIEVAVLGNREPVASVCGEVVPDRDFYSYESKYDAQSGTKLVVPAVIDESISEIIRETAIKIYLELDCRGLARVDFFLHRKTGAIYFNEINTIPGFTSISMYPRLFEASGIPYPQLIDRLIGLALEEVRPVG